jgi:hypothetical protein
MAVQRSVQVVSSQLRALPNPAPFDGQLSGKTKHVQGNRVLGVHGVSLQTDPAGQGTPLLQVRRDDGVHDARLAETPLCCLTQSFQ